MKEYDFTGTKVWEEKVVIPTYPAGKPEKYPLFLENRVYQGSSGKVYPFPVTEKISDVREDISYQAVFLENRFLKVMILPELGGRIQRALDKTNHYDFIYYNHVIKPALVGLTGPWISGGIEFNWPQHHRPDSFLPVSYSFQEKKDGSASVFLSDTDRMYGTSSLMSVTLYPDKAYIEINGKLYNGTDIPQSFLWWANPAVPVNDHTFSVFPPDVHAVMDHGKRAVSSFPIATGEYYKVDYSSGVDISRYKNIPVPTSYMAAHSDYDFIGNFDEEKDAGLLHVADHHISPGKKQWTWGNSDFGRAWDRNLTDGDGPYIELMTGVFTDNQPDFTWMDPYEEKNFTQYFMPYRHVGRVKNATRDAAVNLEREPSSIHIKACVSGIFPAASVFVMQNDQVIFSDRADLSPEKVYDASFSGSFPADQLLTVSVNDEDGRVLVRFREVPDKTEPLPEPAKELPEPSRCLSAEDLYLAAVHLTQYRHATVSPLPYYLEGLRRYPDDIRLNIGYGTFLYRSGRFSDSIPFFRQAIEKETRKNPNPDSGKAFRMLGLALDAVGEQDRAFDAFYKSVWCDDTQSSGYYKLALICARRRSYKEALNFIELSLSQNFHHMKARVLKASLLRKTNREVLPFIRESLAINPLDTGILFEQFLCSNDPGEWIRVMNHNDQLYFDLSLLYAAAGNYEDALLVFSSAPGKDPLLFYYSAFFLYRCGRKNEALSMLLEGEKKPVDFCFPNRLPEISILETGISLLKEAGRESAHADYFLGCLFYDRKRYDDAAAHWESAVKDNPSFAPAFRNLSLYSFNQKNDAERAMLSLKRAVSLEPENSRLLMEYDQLSEKTGISNSERLSFLSGHSELLPERDILFLSYITLLNNTGEYEKALNALSGHHFHPWEGGEGKVAAQYCYALTRLAALEIESGNPDAALKKLEASFSYPENLGEGKLPNVQDTIARYLSGLAYEKKGDVRKMNLCFRSASVGLTEPNSVLYYNDQPCDTIFYQGLSCEKLGEEDKARRWYQKLLSYGEAHIHDTVHFDFFAVSLPQTDLFREDLQEKNTSWCNYLMALGEMGLGNPEKAKSLFAEILKKHPGDQGAIRHSQMLDGKSKK